MADPNHDNSSDSAFKHTFTPESLMNMLVKTFGIYWFVAGILNSIETVYAGYLGRIKDMTVHIDDQPFTTIWGVAMLAVGAWLVVYSKWITRIAYAFDVIPESRTEDPDAQV